MQGQGPAPVSDTNVPQDAAGSGAGMSPMPASGVPGSPPPASTGSFDPAALGTQTNADTAPEGAQADMTGRMLNSAHLIRQANPDMGLDDCAVLAVLACRKTAANPLGFGDRSVSEGPITQRIKQRVHDLTSGDFQRQRMRQRGRPTGHPRPVGQPRPGRAPVPAPAGSGAPGGSPAPQRALSDQLLDLLPMKPHERRLVDTLRGLLKKHRDQKSRPPMPHPNAPPIPAPPGMGDDEDIRRGEPPAPVPDDVEPHDLSEDDQPGGRPDAAPGKDTAGGKAAVRHQADNPLDFGNRAPVPAGPIEQKAVEQAEKVEDIVGGFSSLPKPGDAPGLPGGGKGGGKPGAAAAEADMAPMIAV